MQCRRPGFDPWVGKIPWRGNGHPPQYSTWRIPRTVQSMGRKESGTTERLSPHFGSHSMCGPCLYPPLRGAKPLSVAAAVVATACQAFSSELRAFSRFPCRAGTRNKQVWWLPVVVLTACTWGSWGSLVANAARGFLVLPTSYCLGFIFVLTRICETPKPDPAAICPPHAPRVDSAYAVFSSHVVLTWEPVYYLFILGLSSALGA